MVVAIGWTDKQLPLTYKFVFLTQGDTVDAPFTRVQQTASKTVRLPAGLITLRVFIYDAMGDYTLFTYANNIRVSQVQASSILLLAVQSESDYWKTVAAQNAVQPQQQLQVRRRALLMVGGLPDDDIAHHVIGCHSTQQTRVHNACR